MDSLNGWSFMLAVILAAAFEIVANLLLSKSEGFRRLGYSFAALFLVGLAFTCLSYAVRGMDLSVAYALWGGFGILGTSLGGWVLFNQKLRPSAWCGIILLIGGMAVLRLSDSITTFWESLAL